MSRINTNVDALVAANVLRQQNDALSTSLQRLSTGLRINRGADDPAGLIAAQKLGSESAALTAAIGNANRAGQVVNTAEGGLTEVSSLLVQLQGLVTSTSNTTALSDAEKQANQQQIDSILQTIDHVASTTNFAGTKLLNGSLDFQITGQSSKVANFSVDQSKFSTAAGSTLAVNAVITNSAQHGTLFLSTGTTSLDLSASTAQFSFDLAGATGVRSFSFASGTTLASVATSINNFKSVTGVSATASGNVVKFKSTDFGSSNFVSLRLTNRGGQAGNLALASTTNENAVHTASPSAFSSLSGVAATRSTGQDVGAIINGLKATGSGTKISVNSDALAVRLDLTGTAAQTAGSFTAFTLTGGGATFNLGAEVNLDSQFRLGLGNVATSALGDTTTGFLSDLGSGKSLNLVNGDLTKAEQVIGAAIDQVSNLRGRLGSFQNFVVGSTVNSLNIALENTSAAQSAIQDTDFAKETASLTRAQILVQAATNSLSVAKAQPSNVLKLLQ